MYDKYCEFFFGEKKCLTENYIVNGLKFIRNLIESTDKVFSRIFIHLVDFKIIYVEGALAFQCHILSHAHVMEEATKIQNILSPSKNVLDWKVRDVGTHVYSIESIQNIPAWSSFYNLVNPSSSERNAVSN